MAANVYDWSLVAANNSNSDGDLTWAEGQAPSTVNNSARVMMQRVKQLLVDIGGSLAAGGTANGLTVTANAAFTAYADGMIISFRATASNSGAATLNVNGIGAKAIQKMAITGDVAIEANDIRNTGIYLVQYSAALNGASGAWLLVNPTLSNVVTLAGTQTLTNKTLTSPIIGGTPTAAGSTWANLGTVTTADINGGTVDGTIIGGAAAAAGTFTTVTAANGSAAAPGHRFVSGTSGIFRNTDDGVGFSVTGSDRANVHSTGITAGIGLGPNLVDPTGPSAGVSLSYAGGYASYLTAVGASMQLGQVNGSFTAINFIRVATSVGTITCSAGATAYNTSSDKTLKEDWAEFDAGAILDALEVWRFKWKDGGTVGYGVLAQDAYEVFPQAITKPINDNENWSADYSKFVPLLMAEVKDLRRRMAAAGI